MFGPQSYHRLPELLARAERDGKAVDTEFPLDDKFDHLAAPSLAAIRARGVSAFVTVQEGCDKFCTFCVVPYTRGAEVSRPVDKIVAEVEHLAAAGVREITLIGQNVNAYHGEGPDGRPWSLARLLERIAQIDGIERLRYTTSHPRDMDDDLIAAHRDLREAHAATASAGAIGLRPHPRGDEPPPHPRGLSRYRRAGCATRAARSRADVRFHRRLSRRNGSDFAATLSLIDEVGFAGAFSFKYSPRPGTPGADMDDQVAEEVKSERLQRLQDAIDRSQAAFNRRCLGRTFDVLFERPGRHHGQIVGRSPYLQPVQVEAPASLIGEIATVTITEIASNSLFGTLAHTPAAPTRRHGSLRAGA